MGEKMIASYIYEYLKSIDKEDIIDTFDLKPFEIQVQALERTFIDKLFAICYETLKENLKNIVDSDLFI